ncbi:MULTISPECIES: mechanosensitive ion channel family protein [Cupriavidus]|uniref:mechanosensitive ion channel family protein n=1 Tax=Cupriavidus TaxID=106589 RepID=UPI0009F747DE|nr:MULTISPECIES: mechanosensitive ion channel family protein [Cupriavidus]
MDLPIKTENLWFDVLLSALIVLGGVIVVKLVNRFFRGRQQADTRDNYRAWTVASRNLVAAVVFLLLLGIWVSELKSVAISLAAFAAAILLVGKELVMCFLGAFMRMMSRPFQLGDLVEIGPHCGEVIDQDVLTTTLVEVGSARQYTGFTVQIPNSLLLTTAVRNHSRTGKYTLDQVRFPLAEGADPEAVEARLVAIGRLACADFLEEAGRSLRHHGDMHFVDLSQFEPRVLFEPAGPGRMDALLRFPAPVIGRVRVAQHIIRAFHRADGAPDPGVPRRREPNPQAAAPDPVP